MSPEAKTGGEAGRAGISIDQRVARGNAPANPWGTTAGGWIGSAVHARR